MQPGGGLAAFVLVESGDAHNTPITAGVPDELYSFQLAASK